MTQDSRTEPQEVVEAMRATARRYENTMGLTREGAIRRVEVLHDALLDFADRVALASLSTPPKVAEGLDSKRLDWLQSESADVRWHSDGDDGIILEIVGHWQAEPCERLLAMNSHEDLRDAIDEAMTGQVLEHPPIGPRATALHRESKAVELLREARDDTHLVTMTDPSRSADSCYTGERIREAGDRLTRIDTFLKETSNVG